MRVFAGVSYLIPRLVLLLVVAFALTSSFAATLWFSFAAGMLAEFFSGRFFGAMAFAYILAGISVYLLTRKLTAQEIGFYTGAILAVLQTLLFGISVYIFGLVAGLINSGEVTEFREIFNQKLVWTALVNIVFFYPVRGVFRLLPK